MLIVNFIKKVGPFIRSLVREQPDDMRMAVIRHSLLSELSESAASGRTPAYRVAVQGLHDPVFYSLFAAIMTDLRKKISIDGRLLLVHSISCAIGSGWRQTIMRSLPVSWLVSSQWARANYELIGPVGYRSQSLSHPIGDLFDRLRAVKIWKALQSSNDISKFSVDDILVGDLVIDSYLRFRPSPEFKIADPFVKLIIWQALRDLRRARHFFRNIRPNLYLSSYSTYVEHGIAVRVALKCGVTVRVYGNPMDFGKKLSLNYVYHTPDTENYRKNFAVLSNQLEYLAAAEKALSFRFSGGIDTATSYMRVSAYAESDEPVPNVAGAVVIFLHDFYDSPHVYADLVFPDFWAWITFTIEILKRAEINFWIKPHPNQISLSDTAFKELLRRFPDLCIISPKITNAQLANAGMKCGVTVYGTVAHELAYMGIPSIGCARHPHNSFDFCRTAYDLEQYKLFLLNPGFCLLSKNELRNQALQFFYMHNLHGDDDELSLRAQLLEFFKLADDKSANDNFLLDWLTSIRRLPAWQSHVNLIVDDIVKDNVSRVDVK